MAASNTNTDVIVDGGSVDPPCCAHGPTLLFERFTQSKGSRKFYACAAFRDKKMCTFFRWADDQDKKKGKGNPHCTGSSNKRLELLRKRFLSAKKQPVSKRALCIPCSLLLLADEVKEHKDKGHKVKDQITEAALQHPTTLFEPNEDNKTFAQYLFADSTVQFLTKRLEDLNKTHILCVGTPRLHESICSMREAGETGLTSLLMDLDSRYAQVYPVESFCCYNMFNHHFFDSLGEKAFTAFLREAGAGLLLVTDPPFGGMVGGLAETFRKIEDAWKTETVTVGPIPIVWFFPYFMEKRVIECMPSLTMLDYKVDYDNHNLFKSSKQKKGSPVRIFTNLPPVSFPLPDSDGYWFCDVCQRYSSPENQHCEKCDSCTSKDGTTYQHCNECDRCVKSTRVHCQSCGVCDLPDHMCGQRAKRPGCYICGALGHKRRDCPQRHTPAASRSLPTKRSAEGTRALPKKKKRTK